MDRHFTNLSHELLRLPLVLHAGSCMTHTDNVLTSGQSFKVLPHSSNMLIVFLHQRSIEGERLVSGIPP